MIFDKVLPLSDTREPECSDVKILDYNFVRLLSDTLVNSLPLPQYIILMANAGKKLLGYRLNYHAYLFCENLVHGKLTNEDVQKHNLELICYPSMKTRELAQLICMLETHTQEKLTCVFERIYEAFVKNEINWEYFCELAEINRRMIASDYEILKVISSKKNYTEEEGENSRIFRINRLVSLGLLDVADRDGFWHGKYVNVSTTRIGCDLAKYI